jgi:ABC-type multidrug transport system fused ATPase/permease subunit
MISAIQVSFSFLSRKERLAYVFLVGLRALSGLLDVLGIALIGLVAGLAATNLDPAKPLVIFGITLPSVTQETMLWLVIGVLIVFAMKAVVAVLLGKFLSVFLARIESEKAEVIARYLFMGSLSNIQSLNKGEIVWGLMGSVSFAFSGLLSSLSTFISEGLLLILVATTFFVVDPIATLFVFAYFGLIIMTIQLVIGHALKRAGIDSAEGNMESLVVVDDVLGAFREISIFNKQGFFVSKFTQARLKLAMSNGSMTFLGGMPRYVVETALMLGVVLFVGYQFVTGQLASGLVTVGVFLTGGVRIMASLLPLQNAVATVKNQVEQSRVAQDLLIEAKKAQADDIQPSKTNAATTIDIRHALSVSLSGVSFSYPGAQNAALRDINVEIHGGQHVAFIGPSGAGKTTIVDMVLGLIAPSEGEVIVGDGKYRVAELLRAGLVSYVPQNPGIVSGSIAANVALGVDPLEWDETRINQALEAAHLSDFVDTLPDGIHSSVGNQSDALSGGQIQRLGLARALYVRPKLIVLDEATSALDASSEALISDSLKALGDDVTVIVIAHRLSTVQHSDVVFVVEAGAITASGSFSHLRKTVPMVAEYVKLMSFDSLED